MVMLISTHTRTLFVLLFSLFLSHNADAKSEGSGYFTYFTTDLNPDPNVSKFKENFLRIDVNKASTPMKSISYCLRWNIENMNFQCLFRERAITFKLTNPEEGVGYIGIQGIFNMFKLPEHIKLYPRAWYHTCVSYDGKYSGQNHVTMVVNNETLINQTISRWPEFQMESSFELGYCKYSTYTSPLLSANGMLDPLKAIYRGAITDFNIWSRALTIPELANFAGNCKTFYGMKNEADIINWSSLTVLKRGQNSVNETVQNGSTKICPDTRESKTTLILPILQTYSNSKLFCEQLGGYLPLLEISDDFNNLDNTFSDSNRYDKEQNDLVNTCNERFWMPIKQHGFDERNEKYLWVDDTTKGNNSVLKDLPWSIGQPNGFDQEQCVLLKKRGYVDAECNRKFCSFCSFDKETYFTLHGLNSTFEIDAQYVFLPRTQVSRRLEFLGYLGDKIIFDLTANRWQILGQKTGEVVAYHNVSEGFPIGRKVWVLKMKKYKDTRMEYKFSQCQNDQFTCDDGRCINLDDRCNEIANCADESDENNCQNVFIDPERYRQEYPPIHYENGTKLDVLVGMQLLTISDIQEVEMSYKVKFVIKLEWKDERLKYYNLNNEVQSNIILKKDRKMLWIPPLVFDNTDTNIMVTNEEPIGIYVRRIAGKRIGPIEDIDENYLYSGSENILFFRKDFFLELDCDFDLRLYPFDTQVCTIQIRARTRVQKLINLVVGELKFSGKESLTQFYVEDKRMILKQSNMIVVEITLKRIFNYHMGATFIPTILLLIIGEITLFVDDSHFEATIMVSLTTMLVMYTLFQSTTASLPPTADLKLIDIWLIHGFVGPFLVFMVLVANKLLAGKRHPKIERKHEFDTRQEECYTREGEEIVDPMDKAKYCMKQKDDEGKCHDLKEKRVTLSVVKVEPVDIKAESQERNIRNIFSSKLRCFKFSFKTVSNVVIPSSTILFVVTYIIVAITAYNKK